MNTYHYLFRHRDLNSTLALLKQTFYCCWRNVLSVGLYPYFSFTHTVDIEMKINIRNHNTIHCRLPKIKMYIHKLINADISADNSRYLH